jgi:hypothetical protein
LTFLFNYYIIVIENEREVLKMSSKYVKLVSIKVKCMGKTINARPATSDYILVKDLEASKKYKRSMVKWLPKED